jgi:hypothetical protein
MGHFELNEVEKENQKTLEDSIKILYGDDVEYKVQYLITHTGIGLNIEVIITSKKRVFLPIRKDITDYNSW